MTAKHHSQRRYPPELRERAVRMALELIAEQNGGPWGSRGIFRSGLMKDRL